MLAFSSLVQLRHLISDMSLTVMLHANLFLTCDSFHLTVKDILRGQNYHNDGLCENHKLGYGMLRKKCDRPFWIFVGNHHGNRIHIHVPKWLRKHWHPASHTNRCPALTLHPGGESVNSSHKPPKSSKGNRKEWSLNHLSIQEFYLLKPL